MSRRRCRALAAVCIAATACGGHTATKQDVIARANGICINALRAARSVPPPAGAGGSPAALAAYLQKVVPIVREGGVRHPGAAASGAGPSRPGPLRGRRHGQRRAQYRALATAAKNGDAAAVSAGPGGAAREPGAGPRSTVRTEPMQRLRGHRSVRDALVYVSPREPRHYISSVYMLA